MYLSFFVSILYHILIHLSIPFSKFVLMSLDVSRLNTPVYATGKRSCLSCLRRRLFVGVLQGLPRSPQPLMLRMPAATPPPAVLVRGGSTKYRMGVVSRAAECAPCWSVCRSASLILTRILYHKGSDLSIPFSKVF